MKNGLDEKLKPFYGNKMRFILLIVLFRAIKTKDLIKS